MCRVGGLLCKSEEVCAQGTAKYQLIVGGARSWASRDWPAEVRSLDEDPDIN